MSILRKQKDAAAPSNIQAQLTRLENLLLEQGHIPIETSQDRPPDAPQAPKSLNVPQFSAPTFDDDDDEPDILEVKRDESAGDIAVQNFLKSAMGLQNNISSGV